ncbi:aldehyde dehydrogenase family protein, partial [Microbacterium sp. ISL-103]|uniref:aldehyde dehydrogenase family protein n=1 Tax=Microbacterium sp. ISL-103 TaxID=2819156 RepID=UPI0020360292
MTFQPMQYIAGVRRDGAGDHVTHVTNPADGTLLAEFTGADAADVNDAVSAARRASVEWGRALPSERAAVLTAAARIFDTSSTELAELESRQAGKPIRLTSEFDVPGTSDNISFFAGAARHLEGKAAAEYMPGLTSMIRREPVGVVGAIAPWNYPLQMAAWKILPAIAAGNTIVLKPSELTPLTTLRFAEILSEAGLPPGVVNVVTGRGQETGAALLAHPATDMLSFTGSTRVGQTVQQAAANGAKRLHLEL